MRIVISDDGYQGEAEVSDDKAKLVEDFHGIRLPSNIHLPSVAKKFGVSVTALCAALGIDPPRRKKADSKRRSSKRDDLERYLDGKDK